MTDYANRSARGRARTDDEESLRERLDAAASRERRDAALGLVDLAEREGLAPATTARLAERATGDQDAEVRQFAVEALGLAAAAATDGGPERAVGAIRTALEDDSEWVRAEAVVAHSRTAPEDGAPLRAALEDGSGWVRRNALVALAKTGAASQELLVERLRTDSHPAVREYAADYLREYAEDVADAVRVLAALLARDSAAFVRATAATSLGALGTDRAEAVLEDHGLTDRSDDVRRAARRALATARGVDPESIDVDPDAAGPGSGTPRTGHSRDAGPGAPAPGGPVDAIDGYTQGQRRR